MTQLLAILLLLATSYVSASSLPVAANYVGREACVNCHQQQHDLWQGSHHDLAMQHANDKSVLGDFSNATFSYAGVEPPVRK